MTDFFDWLTASDSGIGADRLADAFNLSHEELRKTMTALAPAFALALQRAMIVPGAWSEISRHYKPFLNTEASDVAFGGAMSPFAGDLSRSLFGSQELVSAVARHVSVASGVAPDTVETMMRNISVMTIGTMLQMMFANLTRSQPKELVEGNYPGAIAEMLRRSANAVEAMGRPSDEARPRKSAPQLPGSDYLSRLFANALTGTLPWLPPETSSAPRREAASGPSRERSLPELPFPPYLALMEEFMRGERRAPTSPQETPPPAAGKALPAGGPRSGAEGGDKPQTPGNAAEGLAEAALAFQRDYARRMMEVFAPAPRNGETRD
ncbi:hypothetical protein [Jiella sonneratiae]|uniref:DUF937 domain-containing protein n=1 Tax=Jiella sonneratiae TaxID=2816856 RepID=A0ABS3J037_9HYPH|nr:hypothetical protein [Jiella sonneratiae]MBO0903021.1 hypothetical protein [Jiella sonneratiae]